ncbi:hypothetical protein D8674_011941 [Pyrus ussuriensis x Pyrus communis]|uniref:Uncharacterized protein n=1 Tax=Pyrus ussuriensis x Pyrus communis TaxID=2448454 RepID=A0A5N5G096_9ROSA|nr:hypothetical protein D8674_011941 [Pyrus ussuriensis x Pyrus communis]
MCQNRLPVCHQHINLLRTRENNIFQMQLQITYMDNLSVWSRLQGNGRRSKLKAIVMEMKRKRVLFSLSKRAKSIGKTNGPVAKEPSLAPATSSTTDTVSGDSGGNNKKEEKDRQGNKGKTGYRSCTVGSCMLFSSTTWWFIWYSVEINLVGYVILYDWMNM